MILQWRLWHQKEKGAVYMDYMVYMLQTDTPTCELGKDIERQGKDKSTLSLGLGLLC